MRLYARLALLALLALASCKPAQQTARQQQRLGIEPFSYEYLSIKSKFRLDHLGEETKASAHIRIRRDSLIWMSVSKTNVEGLRILVTPDSFLMVDRINKQYLAYDYARLREVFNFSFDYRMLEAALVGEPYFPNGPHEAQRKTPDELVFQDQLGGISLEQFVAKATRKLLRVEARDSLQQQLQVEYQAFEPVEGQLFAHGRTIRVDFRKDEAPVQSTLELEYNKVSVADSTLKFPFKVNDKYTRAE
jgi:hypothetical protein